MPVIYIDVLLALNLWIDFLLLLATARLLRIPRKRWRMVLGALAGAAFSCLIFLPAMPAGLSVAVKLLAAGGILLIAFPFQGWLPYIKAVAVFFIISTLFAGMAAALWFFAAPQGFYVVRGVVYYDVSPLTLVLLTVISYGALCLFDRFIRKKAPVNREYRVLVTCGEETVSLRALYDSGNCLKEPFSGSPVLVVRRGALEPVLPAGVREALEAEEHPAVPLGGGMPAGGTAARHRVRLIPFRSVGGEGLLPAFVPDRLTVTARDGAFRDITGAYIALSRALGRGEYDCLLGSDIADLFVQSAPGWTPAAGAAGRRCLTGHPIHKGASRHG